MDASSLHLALTVEFMRGAFWVAAPPNFSKTLPQLYRPEVMHWQWGIRRGDQLMAIVGLFPRTLLVLGAELKVGGIGGVSTHQRLSRGSGHMRQLMHHCKQEMISDGCHLAFLGGQRQRYAYYGAPPPALSSSPLIFSHTNLKSPRAEQGSSAVARRSAFRSARRMCSTVTTSQSLGAPAKTTRRLHLRRSAGTYSAQQLPLILPPIVHLRDEETHSPGQRRRGSNDSSRRALQVFRRAVSSGSRRSQRICPLLEVVEWSRFGSDRRIWHYGGVSEAVQHAIAAAAPVTSVQA